MFCLVLGYVLPCFEQVTHLSREQQRLTEELRKLTEQLTQQQSFLATLTGRLDEASAQRAQLKATILPLRDERDKARFLALRLAAR